MIASFQHVYNMEKIVLSSSNLFIYLFIFGLILNFYLSYFSHLSLTCPTNWSFPLASFNSVNDSIVFISHLMLFHFIPLSLKVQQVGSFAFFFFFPFFYLKEFQSSVTVSSSMAENYHVCDANR